MNYRDNSNSTDPEQYPDPAPGLGGERRPHRLAVCVEFVSGTLVP